MFLTVGTHMPLIFLRHGSEKMAEDVPVICAALFSLVLVIHTKLEMFFIDFLRFAMSVSKNHLNIWCLSFKSIVQQIFTGIKKQVPQAHFSSLLGTWGCCLGLDNPTAQIVSQDIWPNSLLWYCCAAILWVWCRPGGNEGRVWFCHVFQPCCGMWKCRDCVGPH